jgi:hypothetical protein
VVVALGRGLEAETPAEAERSVVELAPLVGVEEFVGQILLKPSESASGGAAPLSPEDSYTEDVLARMCLHARSGWWAWSGQEQDSCSP